MDTSRSTYFTMLVVQIEGMSYRLREHADLLPDHAQSLVLLESRAHRTSSPAPRKSTKEATRSHLRLITVQAG